MLTLKEIEAVFATWQQQAQVSEQTSWLWNCLLYDLRMAVEAKQ